MRMFWKEDDDFGARQMTCNRGEWGGEGDTQGGTNKRGGEAASGISGDGRVMEELNSALEGLPLAAEDAKINLNLLPRIFWTNHPSLTAEPCCYSLRDALTDVLLLTYPILHPWLGSPERRSLSIAQRHPSVMAAASISSEPTLSPDCGSLFVLVGDSLGGTRMHQANSDETLNGLSGTKATAKGTPCMTRLASVQTDKAHATQVSLVEE